MNKSKVIFSHRKMEEQSDIRSGYNRTHLSQSRDLTSSLYDHTISKLFEERKERIKPKMKLMVPSLDLQSIDTDVN